MLLKPVWILTLAYTFMFSAERNDLPKEKIEWLTLEEAAVKMQNEHKPIIIDLYTNWCNWCKEMDKKTYNNDKVAKYINQNFYPVKINAETQETVQWLDKEYNYNKSVKVNEFSLFVTNGQLSYPTTVIMMHPDEVPAAIPGFMSADEIEPILKYFAEDYYKRLSFQDFLRGFRKGW